MPSWGTFFGFKDATLSLFCLWLFLRSLLWRVSFIFQNSFSWSLELILGALLFSVHIYSFVALTLAHGLECLVFADNDLEPPPRPLYWSTDSWAQLLTQLPALAPIFHIAGEYILGVWVQSLGVLLDFFPGPAPSLPENLRIYLLIIGKIYFSSLPLLSWSKMTSLTWSIACLLTIHPPSFLTLLPPFVYSTARAILGSCKWDHATSLVRVLPSLAPQLSQDKPGACSAALFWSLPVPSLTFFSTTVLHSCSKLPWPPATHKLSFQTFAWSNSSAGKTLPLYPHHSLLFAFPWLS